MLENTADTECISELTDVTEVKHMLLSTQEECV